MGGSLSFTSEVGKGSAFTFTVPFQRVYSKEEPANTLAETLQKPVSILVVDDNPVNVKVMCKMIEMSGSRAKSALSGNEALVKIAHESFDAIFLDLQMPELGNIVYTLKI